MKPCAVVDQPEQPPCGHGAVEAAVEAEASLRLGRDEERYAIDEGEPLEVTIRGKAYELTPDAALVLRPA